MNRFEELAKGLAAGMKRREALRRMGGGLAGALLASFGVGRARADGDPDPPPNAFCEKDCGVFFPPPRGKDTQNAFGQCVSSCEDCANSGGQVCFGFSGNCEGNGNCFCGNTTEGSGFCFHNAFCNQLPTCTTSADCPTGWFCSATTCCTVFGFGNICLPPCSVNPSGLAAVPASDGAASGPTAAGV